MNKQPEMRARTREGIVDAFLSLYEGRSIREVTVAQVSAAAHVNRSTFYEYFDSVYDLLDQAEGVLVEQVARAAETAAGDGRHLDEAEFARQGVMLFEESGGRMGVLVSHPGSTFPARLVERMRPLMGSVLGMDPEDPRSALLVSFVLSGVVGSLSSWHRSGEALPRGEVAVLIQRSISGVLTASGYQDVALSAPVASGLPPMILETETT